MARRGGERFEKRQREMARRERSKAKAERKQERAAEPAAEIDEAALYEQFRRLSERHDGGLVSDEDFEAERREIFEQLGIEVD